MFTLAKLLNHTAGFQITFVNTHHNHALLQRSLDTSAFTTSFPGFYFSSLPDVVTHDGRKSNVANVSQLLFSIRDSKSDFLRLMVDLCSGAEGGRCAPTCVIADGIMSFGIDLAEEIGIPVLTFRTFSAVCLWVYFNLDKLKQEALESPVISKLSTIFPKTYPVGPLHGLFNNLVKEERFSSSNGGLWEEDKACMTWLDSQPSRSVIYVSFGSLVVFTEDQFTEFWHGLVNAGKPFLWVIRPDSVDGLAQSGQVISDLKEAHGKCCLVDWAPQLDVLAHEAVGGFLTHTGWNSTLEAILEGVPMICCPKFSDQQVNSRAVSEIWRIGLDMKDTWDRSTVEKMVRDLMDDRRDEIMKSTAEIARLARDSIKEGGGSSFCNLEKLIEDIRAMC
ncbi:7-deoxyloganetic acid glucosyltransferase [Linum perenne]